MGRVAWARTHELEQPSVYMGQTSFKGHIPLPIEEGTWLIVHSLAVRSDWYNLDLDLTIGSYWYGFDASVADTRRKDSIWS